MQKAKLQRQGLKPVGPEGSVLVAPSPRSLRTATLERPASGGGQGWVLESLASQICGIELVARIRNPMPGRVPQSAWLGRGAPWLYAHSVHVYDSFMTPWYVHICIYGLYTFRHARTHVFAQVSSFLGCFLDLRKKVTVMCVYMKGHISLNQKVSKQRYMKKCNPNIDTLQCMCMQFCDSICHVCACYVMLCYVMLCYVMLMLCYVNVMLMLCYVMLCYVMLCYVMLCYVTLCYVTLCYVMLCYVACACRMYGCMYGWMDLCLCAPCCLWDRVFEAHPQRHYRAKSSVPLVAVVVMVCVIVVVVRVVAGCCYCPLLWSSSPGPQTQF